MNQIFIWANAHGVLVAAAVGVGLNTAQWVFSVAVSAMPPLPDNATYNERWRYQALHTIAGNLDKVRAAKGQ